MPIASFWNLCTEFSIHDAALVIAGHDPQAYIAMTEDRVVEEAIGYLPARKALSNAVESERLATCKLIYDVSEFDQRDTLNIYSTLIRVEDLDRFVRNAGHICETFARGSETMSRYTCKNAAYRSKKLEAANKAWEAITANPALLRGKSPKQALQKWLTEHAEELGLLNRDGRPNQTGIEEICKVANWKPEGGATPTPASPDPESETRLVLTPPLRSGNPKEAFDLNDDIPF